MSWLETRIVRAALAVLVLLVAAPGAARGQDTIPRTSSEIGVAPGDFIRVEIWQEKDLSGDFLVNPDSSAVFPLLGPQRVGGIPVVILRDSLVQRYRKYLRNPSINVTPLRRVQVLGEVNRPGVYTMDPTVSLTGLLALASGPNPNGDVRNIRIVRNGQVHRARVGPGMSLMEADVRSGDQVVVGPKNWFVRNSTFVVSLALSIPATIIAVIGAL